MRKFLLRLTVMTLLFVTGVFVASVFSPRRQLPSSQPSKSESAGPLPPTNEQQPTPPDVREFRIRDFLNENYGWAVKGNNLFKTEDDGGSWADIRIAPKVESTFIFAPQAFLNEIQLVSPDEGWALESDYLIHTSDGGASWSEHKFKDTIVSSFRFADRKKGWFAGQWLRVPQADGDYERWYPVIYVTNDGGQNWRQVYKGDENPYPLWGVWAVSAREIWAVGALILHSVDGGRTWVEVNPGAGLSNREVVYGIPYEVKFVDSLTGWIKTNQGDRYYYTNNGGRTWHVDVSIPERNSNHHR